MEGPSLYLAQEQLQPFKGQIVLQVVGNTKQNKDRLLNQEVQDIFSWGKHLIFQFETFAIRIHFLLFGTFEATVNEISITGDYKKKVREPRLALTFANGHIEMYSCSVIMFDDPNLKAGYDFSISIMSPEWDGAKAFEQVKKYPDEEIGDVLLDQTVFAGVGNIIKNEVLSLAGVNPHEHISRLSDEKIRELIDLARSYSLQFYEWRKNFVLRKHLKVHHQKFCPHCHRQLFREKTGKRQRWSYFCSYCQGLD